MDGFMFGSCCLYSEESPLIADDAYGVEELDKNDDSIPTTLTSFEDMDEDNSIDHWTHTKRKPGSVTTTTSTSKRTTTTMATNQR